MIIAVDFDGTLCRSVWPGIGEPNIVLINYIDQPVGLLNVNESNLLEPPIASTPEPLLKSLRREVLDSAVIKISSTSVDGNQVTDIYYEEDEA